MRSYGQYCGLARSLEVVGDRWNLLIVRQLLVGSARYRDLFEGLPGIATNLLAERLRDLEREGIVTREEAPPPIATTLFRLTPRGQELETTLFELGRWGAPLMTEPDEQDAYRVRWLAFPISLLVTDRTPDEPPVTTELRTGEEAITIEARDGEVHTHPGPAEKPDLILTGPPQVLVGVFTGQLDLTTARGQYAAGWQGGVKVPGFREEEGIARGSRTDTYAAMRLDIDTRRWAGVPFYLRTGKRLPRRATEVALMFQKAPHLPFSQTDTEELGQNALIIRVQPDEGVTLRFGSKVPGTSMEVRDVNMDFDYGESFTESSPEAYERLLLDVLIGDPPLFPRQEEVELSWKILDPVEEYWDKHGEPQDYLSGTWGPTAADEMMARDGRAWRRL